jgi:hypothetical protein
MTTWTDVGDRVDELWSDDFEVLHRVVLTKRLPVSNLADSPAADPTTPRQPDRWRSAVADAGDLPELSPPLMAAGGIWLRSTSFPAEKSTLWGVGGRWVITVISVAELWVARHHTISGRPNES